MILHCKCCVWGSQKCTFFVWGGHIWDPLLVWFRNILRVKIWLMGSFERCAEKLEEIRIPNEAPDGVFGRWEIRVKFWEKWEIWLWIFWEMGDWLSQRAKKWEKWKNTREHLFGSREIGRNKSGRWEIEPPPPSGASQMLEMDL